MSLSQLAEIQAQFGADGHTSSALLPTDTLIGVSIAMTAPTITEATAHSDPHTHRYTQTGTEHRHQKSIQSIGIHTRAHSIQAGDNACMNQDEIEK